MRDLEYIKHIVAESVSVKQALLADERLLQVLESTVAIIVQAFRNGNKVLLCGNGGSAADAQHIAAELSGRFFKDRAGLYAEALHVNSSYMTAVANDYAFEVVYERLVQAMGRQGDILIAISTSGNSKNVVRAAAVGRAAGMTVIAMTGSNGGALGEICDILLPMPSDATPRIQEAHILCGHILCELVERALF